MTEARGERPPESQDPDKPATGPLTLNTAMKRTFAAIIALLGALAAVAAQSSCGRR